jgi:hypothetical protein
MTTSWDYWAIRVLPFIFTLTLGLFFYFLNKNKPEVWLWLGFTAFVIVGLFVVALIHEKVFSETATSGLLRPASEATPPNPCPAIPKGAIILLFGHSASYTTASHLTVIKVAGEDLLSIDRKNGGIAVSAKIYSADRRMVAEIIDNKFHINPSNFLRRERPDHHTLEIFDQQGQRVLYVRHLNSSAIKVLGTFHSTRGIVRIDENELVLPVGPRFRRLCLGDSEVGIQIN